MKLLLQLATLATLLAVSLPAPCQAAEPPASPELAAGLAIGAPIGLMALSRLTSEPLVLVALPALGLGMGHLYAGRPLRGGVVAVGSSVAGLGVFNLLRPADGSGGAALQAAVLAGAVVAMGLAARDAYAVAEDARPEE